MVKFREGKWRDRTVEGSVFADVYARRPSGVEDKLVCSFKLVEGII